MKLAQRSVSERVRQAWKNGGGVTEELAIHERSGSWLWRLSLSRR